MKTLIFRLSSFGDIILASSVLSSLKHQHVDWVIAEEFSDLLSGHPRIRKLWKFDRKREGLLSWIRLCSALFEEGYDEILDLHRNTRTRIAKVVFFFRSLLSLKKGPVWKTISKSRWRLWGFFLFKSKWPKNLRPKPWKQKFQEFVKAGGRNADLTFLLGGRRQQKKDETYCLAPSSKWKFKEWGVDHFVDFVEKVRSTGLHLKVLGLSSDQAALRLVDRLREKGIDHQNLIGKLSLSELAVTIGNSKLFVGTDSGLAHLAEAVGTPVLVLFGPTVPEMGFGPSDKRSRSVGADLWCRPCGKSGKFCHRFYNRWKCLSILSPTLVSITFMEMVSRPSGEKSG